MRHEPTSGYEDETLNYRVTWKAFSDGETREMIFTSRDEGWDVYQQMLGSAKAYDATWEHIPA